MLGMIGKPLRLLASEHFRRVPKVGRLASQNIVGFPAGWLDAATRLRIHVSCEGSWLYHEQAALDSSCLSFSYSVLENQFLRPAPGTNLVVVPPPVTRPFGNLS